MELKDVVIQAILERKGMFVKDYDCMDITPFMDDIIVVTANNLRQNNAIAQNIKEKVKEDGFDLISFRFGNGKEIGFRILLTTALNDVQNDTAEEIHNNESIFTIRV